MLKTIGLVVIAGPRTGDRQGCQRISGKRRRKFMAVLAVPGALMPRCIIEGEGVPSHMASHSESEMGVNSWLEDELYQQYLRDRSTVDESWKHVFEEPRPQVNGTPADRASC